MAMASVSPLYLKLIREFPLRPLGDIATGRQ